MGFPTSVQTFTTHSAGQTITSSDINLIQTELAAVEAGLLTTGLTQPLPLPSGQIVFPATQNASSNANTLDDYEEGTWTPTLTGGSSTLGYSVQVGFYTKIGRMVFISGNLVVNSKSATGSGGLSMAGLPFAADSTANGRFVGAMDWYFLAAAKITMIGKVQPGATTALIETLGSASVSLGGTQLDDSEIQVGTSLQLGLVYMAAS